MSALYRYELRKLFCRKQAVAVLCLLLALSVLAAIGNAQGALFPATHWNGYESGASLSETEFEKLSEKAAPLHEQQTAGGTFSDEEWETLSYYMGAQEARTPAAAGTPVPAAETPELLKMAETLGTMSVEGGYTGSAARLFAGIPAGFLLPALFLPFLLSGLFAEDARCGMDALQFSARFGRGRLLCAKLLAALTAWLPAAAGCGAICVLPPVLSDPHTDWGASVQLLYPNAAYALTLGEAALWLIAAGVLLSVLSSLFALLLSSLCKASLLGAAGGCMLALYPFLRVLPLAPEARRALCWNVTSLLFGTDDSFGWLSFFDGAKVFGRFSFSVPVIFCLAGIFGAVLLTCCIWRFLTRQVKG